VVTLKKYDLLGKEIGEIAIEDVFMKNEANSQMIKDYIVALRNNARQWSAHTKTRPEVNHSGQKPHKQKGTGNARQGYLGAPQYKGGGRVGGPRAKFDQHVKVNKKEKRAAIRQLLSDKLHSQQVMVLDSSTLTGPKTKLIAKFLESRELSTKRILFLGGNEIGHDQFYKSMRNIPKTKFMPARTANGYEIAVASSIIILEQSVEQFKEIFKD
jgi:large subunit ribosomal protein L4